MRKIKPKMTKRERMKSKIDSEIKKISDPLITVGILLNILKSYLQEHKSLYDTDKYCGLKPYLKGALTNTINNISKFLNENFEYPDYTAEMEDTRHKIDSMVLDSMKTDTKLMEEFYNKEDENNKRLIQTYFCSIVVIGTLRDGMKQRLKGEVYNYIKNKIEDVLHVFDKYTKFWTKEVYSDITITFI